VTIRGAGEDQTVIDGGDSGRVMIISGAPVVTIKNITIQHGHSTNDGGGILNFGNLTLRNSTLTDNEAFGDLGGGGIYNFSGSTATLRNSTVTDNTANLGDDISNEGSLTLRNVTFNECVNFAFGTGCPEP
jgi:Right handed beta helix region